MTSPLPSETGLWSSGEPIGSTWSASSGDTSRARGWAEYESAGTLNGSPLRPGILEAERFGKPLFTPSTKAESGHDIP